MSRATWAPAVSVTGWERAELARFLADSRRLATSVRETMDRCFFRLSAEEARITSPALEVADRLAAALAGDGPVRVEAAGLDKLGKFEVSALLEAAAMRAARWGSTTPEFVAAAVAGLAVSWDQWARVPADPEARSFTLSLPGRERAAAAGRRERERMERHRRLKSAAAERAERRLDQGPLEVA